jgi:Trm5-related predicted tRNA methylase
MGSFRIGGIPDADARKMTTRSDLAEAMGQAGVAHQLRVEITNSEIVVPDVAARLKAGEGDQD